MSSPAFTPRNNIGIAVHPSLHGPVFLPHVASHFNIAALTQHAVLLLALLIVNKAGNAGAALFFVILLYLAASSTTGALKALALIGIGVQLNQFFVPKSLVWTPARLGLSLFCVIRVYCDLLACTGGRFCTYLLFLNIFCATSAVCSVLSGYYTQIALLKLANFWAVVSAVLLAMDLLRRRRIDMTPWFVSLIMTVVFIGIAAVFLGQATNFIPLPDEQLVNRASGFFNGAFLHPNSHSAGAAPLAVFLLAAALFGPYRNKWLCVCLFVILFTFIILSRSRSAVAATLAGLAVLACYSGMLRLPGGLIIRSSLRRSTLVAIGLVSAFGLGLVDAATGGGLSRAVVRFINKAGDQNLELDTEAILRSRQGLIDFSWANFLESPIYGIGFQVAKTEYFQRSATLFTAPAEKGFLPTALLEEGGVLGTSAFVLFLGSLIWYLIKTKNVPGLAVGSAILVSTIPEVSIFAMGGSGTFMWTTFAFAVVLGDFCRLPTSFATLSPPFLPPSAAHSDLVHAIR